MRCAFGAHLDVGLAERRTPCRFVGNLTFPSLFLGEDGRFWWDGTAWLYAAGRFWCTAGQSLYAVGDEYFRLNPALQAQCFSKRILISSLSYRWDAIYEVLFWWNEFNSQLRILFVEFINSLIDWLFKYSWINWPWAGLNGWQNREESRRNGRFLVPRCIFQYQQYFRSGFCFLMCQEMILS